MSHANKSKNKALFENAFEACLAGDFMLCPSRRQNGKNENKALYLALDINMDGRKEVLGFYRQKFSSV